MSTRVPRACGLLDHGAAGITQAQQAGDLVEGLARGVVGGPAQELARQRAPAGVETGVAAGDHQANARVDLAIGKGELAGVEVAFQVIDRDERNVERQGQRLGRGQADDQGPDQARPRGDGDHPQVAERDSRPAQGLVDHGQHLPDVGSRGDLRNHPAEPLMQAHLRSHHAGEDPRHPDGRRPRPLEHRRPGLVAGGLDGQEDQAGCGHRWDNHETHESHEKKAGTAGDRPTES